MRIARKLYGNPQYYRNRWIPQIPTGTIEDNAPVVTIEDATIAGAGGFPVMSNPSATGHHSLL
jgi:hypothetical protein